MVRDIASKASKKYPFGPDDFLQQIIGSAIISTPLLVTQEVWQIAQATSILQSTVSLLATFLMGYGILYVEKHERDFEVERDIAGIKLRYISLMIVTFGTPLFLLSTTAISDTLGTGFTNSVKVVSFASTFAVIGAATADNLI